MNTLQVATFKASATFGLQKEYGSKLISATDFKTALAATQRLVYEELKVVLSTKITFCEIVCLGQEEPSVTLEWIQYPKFEYTTNELKNAIIRLVQLLMFALEQNRVVVIFPEETLCFEQSTIIDPKIKL
jgi:hypothetical protein